MDLADLNKPAKNSTLNKLKGSSAVFADVSEMSSTKSPIQAEKSTSCPQGEYADLQLSEKTTSGYMSIGFSATRRPTVTDHQSLDVDNRAEAHVYLSPGEKTAKSSRSMDGHNRVAPGAGERGPELDLDNGEEKSKQSSFNSGNGKPTSRGSRLTVILGFMFAVSVLINVGAGVLAAIAFHKAGDGCLYQASLHKTSNESLLHASRKDNPQNRTGINNAKGKFNWRNVGPTCRTMLVTSIKPPPPIKVLL